MLSLRFEEFSVFLSVSFCFVFSPSFVITVTNRMKYMASHGVKHGTGRASEDHLEMGWMGGDSCRRRKGGGDDCMAHSHTHVSILE